MVVDPYCFWKTHCWTVLWNCLLEFSSVCWLKIKNKKSIDLLNNRNDSYWEWLGKKWIPSLRRLHHLLWLCTTVLSRCDQTVSGDFILHKVEETTVKVPYLNFDLKFMLSLWNLQKKRFKSNWTCDTVWAALALFKRFHTKYAVITCHLQVKTRKANEVSIIETLKKHIW